MKIAVFDTEDDSRECMKRDGHGFNKKITQIAAMTEDGKSFHNKGNVEEFVKWAKSLKGYCFFGHNIGYDLGIFRERMDEISVLMVGSRIIKAKAFGLTFKDSANLWPMSLQKIGSALGIEKLELSEYSKDYVMRDCEITLKAVLFARDLCSKYDVAKLPSTIGGCAVAIHEARFGSIPHCSDLFVREAYYGGRVEIFKPCEKGEIYYEDVNSMYPWALTKEYPDKCEPLKASLDTHGISYVEMLVKKKEFISPLPHRVNDMLVYPHGNFLGWYPNCELRELPAGMVKRVYKTFGSKIGIRYYQGFMHHFFEKRNSSVDPGHRLFFKLLMNSLSGRLGMKGLITRSADVCDEDFDGDEYIGTDRVYGTKKLVDTEVEPHAFTNYLHAAMLTGYSRAKLYKRIVELGEKSLYCDTDSVIHTGKPNPDSEKLGEWKLEKKCKFFEARLPKMYRLDETYKVKGVSESSVDKRSNKFSRAKQFFEKGETETEAPYKFREAAALFDEGLPRLATWRTIVKRSLADYRAKKTLRGGLWRSKNVSEFEN